MNAETLYALGFALIFLGVMIVLTAMPLLSHLEIKEKETGGGGAIIIGPVPIVFSTDKESVKTILILSIVLTVVLVATTVILHLMSG
jgi:uncharacterized protein (TIGR00304 family)